MSRKAATRQIPMLVDRDNGAELPDAPIPVALSLKVQNPLGHFPYAPDYTDRETSGTLLPINPAGPIPRGRRRKESPNILSPVHRIQTNTSGIPKKPAQFHIPWGILSDPLQKTHETCLTPLPGRFSCVFMYGNTPIAVLRADGNLQFKEALIKSLSDFILGFLCNARNNSTRIASYLRQQSCIGLLSQDKLAPSLHTKVPSFYSWPSYDEAVHKNPYEI